MPNAKKISILSPASPKILPWLDQWHDAAADEVEITDCVVGGKDFSTVKRLEAEGCRLAGTRFAGAKLDKFQLSDTILDRIDAVGLCTSEAAFVRIVCAGSRLTGADFAESLFEDCVFENVKLDEAGLRFATLKRVRFEGCVLRNTDFSGAKLSQVSFSGCELDGANFDNVVCKAVNLHGQNLANVKGVFGLKGATISDEQLIQLAPLLAAEAGLDIDNKT